MLHNPEFPINLKIFKYLFLFFLLFVTNSAFGKNSFPRGLVTSKNPIASQIGAQILGQGGNAIDSAIAVGYALGVVEPQGCGIGGGGFALIYLAKTKELKAIDFRERAPRAINKFEYNFRDGAKSAGVPGTVAGFEYLRFKYGKLSRQASLKPVIQTARQGFPVNQSLYSAIKTRKKVLLGFPSSAQIYLPEGKIPDIGQKIKQTDLANTLQIISAGGKQAFYNGVLAKSIISSTQNFISTQDLKNYRVYELKPLCGNYRENKICSFPLPSSGGVCLLEALNILENFNMPALAHQDPERLHYLIEALRFSFADRATKLGDSRFNQIPVSALLDKKYAKQIAERIKQSPKAIPSEEVFTLNTDEKPETTHFTVADKEGNIVAITISLNGGLGSGFVVPKTGILLNNTLDDFSLPNAVANQYGLIGNNLNMPQPFKTPLSSMSPTIVFNKENKPILALGSPGGPTIISAVLNTLLAYLDHKMPIEQAVTAPRVHHQWQPDHVYIENKEKLEPILKPYNYVFPTPEQAVWKNFYWSVQAIELNYKDNLLNGSSDPRKEQGLVFEN